MFDHRFRHLLLLALAGRSLPAQDTSVVRLKLRTDSLAAEWRRANVLAAIADSLERERATGGRDTIAAGALRIVVNRSPLPVREAAAQAWLAVDSLYGPAARNLVNRPYFILAIDPDTTTRRRVLRVGFEVPWNLGVQDLTSLLLANVPIAPPDRALGDWLGGPLHPHRESNVTSGWIYVRLVTAPSQTARRCFLGDLQSCRAALDLDDSDDPFMQWYPSATERRAVLLQSFPDYFTRPTTVTSWSSCTQGNDTACIRLLRSLPRGAIPQPLDFEARELLAHTALRIGGRGAYERLLADSNAALSTRLAAAADVGLDNLLSEWRAKIIAARPAKVTISYRGILVALGWIVLLVACALTSSRWREA